MRILILLLLAGCGSGDGEKPPIPVKAECKDETVCPMSAGGSCTTIKNPFCEGG